MKALLLLSLIFASCAHKKTAKRVNDERDLLKSETMEQVSNQDLADLDRIELEDMQASPPPVEQSLEVPELEPQGKIATPFPQAKVEDYSDKRNSSEAMIMYTPLWKNIPIRQCKKIVHNPMYVNGACVQRY